MEKIARKIAANLAKSLHYDEEQEAVIAYGMIAITQIVVTIILITIIGILAGVWIEALIITFSVSILRKYSGGSHAKTLELCTAIGVIYSVGFASIAKYILAPSISLEILTLLGIITYAFAYLTIYRLAPVDTPNKPIVTTEKRKRMKKASFIVISLYAVFSIFSLFIGSNNIFYIGIYISLIFGVLWQILTLTKLGAKITSIINSFF